jgi:hypothetical protein
MDFMTENNKMWISGELVPKVLKLKMKFFFVFFSRGKTRTQDFVTENGKDFYPGELVPKIL